MTVVCNNITISIKNGKEIVKNLSFALNDNDKLAIIGEEGNGKSTLLQFFYDKSLVDSYTEHSGSFSIENKDIAYLPQQMNPAWNDYSILDYLFTREINGEINYEFYDEYRMVEKQFNDLNIAYLLEDASRKIRNCSGGEKVKLSLIKLFLVHPKVLLLDEPTNDLDLFTLTYLEAYLLNCSIPIIFISHDIEMLKKVANQILHLEQIKRKTEMKFTYYKGNYENYLQNRENLFAQQEKDHYRTKKEKEDKLEILRHQHLLVENDQDDAVRNPTTGRLLAKKMANIKAREKQVEKLEVVEEPRPEDAINCFFNEMPPIPTKKCLCDLHEKNLSINKKILIEDYSFTCFGPQHIVITGDNGTGKTTFLHHIREELNNVSNIKIGYMPQNYDEGMNLELSPVKYLQEYLGYDKETQAKIMNCLAAMRFEPDEMQKKISEISGGQKAKLYIIQMILTNSNVLLLDEPTRNLSPLSVPKIIKILNDFKGAIISVSHDRTFIAGIGQDIYEIKDKKLFHTIR